MVSFKALLPEFASQTYSNLSSIFCRRFDLVCSWLKVRRWDPSPLRRARGDLGFVVPSFAVLDLHWSRGCSSFHSNYYWQVRGCPMVLNPNRRRYWHHGDYRPDKPTTTKLRATASSAGNYSTVKAIAAAIIAAATSTANSIGAAASLAVFKFVGPELRAVHIDQVVAVRGPRISRSKPSDQPIHWAFAQTLRLGWLKSL